MVQAGCRRQVARPDFGRVRQLALLEVSQVRRQVIWELRRGRAQSLEKCCARTGAKEELARRQQPDIVDRPDAALRRGIECAQRLDLVAEPPDPPPQRLAGREYVDDPAAARELAPPPPAAPRSPGPPARAGRAPGRCADVT